MGVALAKKKAGQSIETFIVARYSPPGNVIGSFEAKNNSSWLILIYVLFSFASFFFFFFLVTDCLEGN